MLIALWTRPPHKISTNIFGHLLLAMHLNYSFFPKLVKYNSILEFSDVGTGLNACGTQARAC